MSGGRWGYLQFQLEEEAETLTNTAHLLTLMGMIEHILDWGRSGDSCYECAKVHTVEILEKYFSHRTRWDEGCPWEDVLAVANKGSYGCPSCRERWPDHYPKAEVCQ